MKISVVGMGRWGSCIAWYLSAIKKLDVKFYGRAGSPDFIRFYNERKNDYIILPQEIELSSDLEYTISSSECIVVSIPAQGFRNFLKEIKEIKELTKQGVLSNKIFVLCMKGIESGTGKRLTQIFREEMGLDTKVAIWVGPGHVQDFYAGRPSCMVISSDDITITKKLVNEFNSNLIRFYYGQDLIGCEIGAAAKNVMGIAAGMLDGIDCPGLKGALMARGAREVARLIRTMGGSELTAYGLSHLGDYQATLFSPYSHNRLFGENYIRGLQTTKLAEGVDTSKAMYKLSTDYNVDLPISTAIYKMLFESKDPRKELEALFDREIKFEF